MYVTDLSASSQRLLRLFQTINFGRLEELEIRNGEPVFSPSPRIFLELKLDVEDRARPEAAIDRFPLRSQVARFFTQLAQLRDGTVECIEIRHGLPFRMVVEAVGGGGAVTVDPFVIQQAEIRASRMVSNNGFRRDEWEDLRQDLLLDYLERLPQFNPDRGDLRGFMFGVVRHRAAQLAAEQRRRLQTLADNGGSPHPHVVVDHDLRLDVAAVLARLPEHLRVTAELLSEQTPREVARVTGKSRSRVYQMIGEIREAFEEAGVRPEGLRQQGGTR